MSTPPTIQIGSTVTPISPLRVCYADGDPETTIITPGTQFEVLSLSDGFATIQKMAPDTYPVIAQLADLELW